METAAPADPLVGKRLASYEVLARVARGGMGVVYRARHVYIDQIVALKVLDPALSSRPELIERFRTEAQSLARVEHENVIKVIDILEDSGVHFIVMDFAEGLNLRQHVKRHGPMPADALLSVARQVGEALDAAHRQGILHRDIKPENLIMNAEGRCKLADFGLAGDLRLIVEGHEGPLNFATPAYSPPEVLRRGMPNERSDIFSFGATLYFLATGEPPYGQAGAQQVLVAQQQGTQPIAQRRPDLPPKLAQLISDCIAHDPADRPAGARNVLERLPRRVFASSLPYNGTPTEPTGPIANDPKPETDSRLARWLTLGAVALGVAALSTVAVLWWAGRDPEPNQATAPPESPPVNTPPVAPRTPSPQNGPEPEAPTTLPEEEAFNAAELESRTALSRADYFGAWQAWTRFIQRYGSTPFADDARRRRTAIVQRVRELRESELRKARDACEAALAERRMADALAALDRFPPELLVALGEDDQVAVTEQLATQRQRVVAVEAPELARLLEQADELRRQWHEAREKGDSLREFERARLSANLLRERDLLEKFIPGRLAETRETLERRLSGLRRLIEAVHQEAREPAVAWRAFHDETLPELAAWLRAELKPAEEMLARRDFKAALRHAVAVSTELERRIAALSSEHAEVESRMRSSALLGNILQRVIDDVRLADSLHDVLETELRTLQRTGATREFILHAEITNGVRSERTIRYSGRVSSVTGQEFTLQLESDRPSLRIDMLTAATARRLLRDSRRPQDVLALVAWLAMQGLNDEAKAELSRLEGATREAIRGAALAGAGIPAPPEMRVLDYLSARGGLMTRAAFEHQHGSDNVHAELLSWQEGVLAGAGSAAEDYLQAVRKVEDPELVSLNAYARALALGSPSESDLRNRTLLEPFSADALAKLAAALQESDPAAAQLTAGRAMILDPSNEAAWAILR